jgi:ligand-binding sensor domain-containing protein
MKCVVLYALFVTLVFYAPCSGQSTNYGPATMVRNVEKDRNGNIWLAAWKDIIRYDGKTFINITSEASSGNYWSVLEDRKGNFWFGTIGSGVYYYDGKTFQHFTTSEGLLNNEVGFIYEDRNGSIWFGVNGGISRYDGESFRNFIISGNSITEDRTGKTLPVTRPPNEVNSVVEDKNGKVWLGTRGQTFVYDGNEFSVFTRDGKGFSNVRSVIEDRKGNIWLGGADGLWRFDGRALVNYTKKFIGYVYEDKKGNIWTSTLTNSQIGLLCRYDEQSLSAEIPTVTEVQVKIWMLCGIIEDNDGNIWVGAADGVYRYDGKTVTGFKDPKLFRP